MAGQRVCYMESWQSSSVILKHCKVTAGRYAKVVMLRFLGHCWMWLALPAALCCMLATLRIEWLVVAVMWAFVAVPMLMPLVYLNYMLTPETRWSLMPKTVVIDNGGIRMDFDGGAYPGVKTIAWNEVAMCEQHGSELIFTLKVRKFQYLLIDTAKPATNASETRCQKHFSGAQ